MLFRYQSFLSVNGILTNLSSYSYNPTYPLTWGKLSQTHAGGLAFVSGRNVLEDVGLKYAEKVEFNTGGSNYAIAIGYNPAYNSPTFIDKTNYLISNLLHTSHYDGYYLLNMFPDVNTTKTIKSASGYPNNIDDALNFLISDSLVCMHDIFIFWGSSTYVSVNVESKLQRLLHLGRQIYTIGTLTTNHRHPGRNVSLSNICYHVANLASITPRCRYLK